jgi:predicted DCC family thiol-disulfide oxidoreductase YuxK
LRVLLGSAEQWLSWIHIADLLRLIDFCVEHKDVQGGVNATAPAPVRQRDFAAAMSNVYGKAVTVRVPAGALRAILGERAQLLVDGQRVVPARALSAGFTFRFATLDAAVRDLLAPAPNDAAPLQIMYDPDCPVCDMEMTRYCRASGRAGHEWRFYDVADRPEVMLRYGLNTDIARRRVYVLTDRGTMLSGIPALRLIWANLPRWRWLAALIRLPGVQPVAEFFYDHVLAPTIWRGNEVRRARAAANVKAAR